VVIFLIYTNRQVSSIGYLSYHKRDFEYFSDRPTFQGVHCPWPFAFHEHSMAVLRPLSNKKGNELVKNVHVTLMQTVRNVRNTNSGKRSRYSHVHISKSKDHLYRKCTLVKERISLKIYVLKSIMWIGKTRT